VVQQLASPGTVTASMLAASAAAGDGASSAEEPTGPPPTQAEILAALGQKHAKLEEQLLALMEEWHDVTDRLSAA